MIDEWEALAVDTATDLTTINDAPTLVRGVWINTALSAHTVVLKDDTTAKYTLPASAAAGAYYKFGPTRFNTSFIVDPHDSSTGNITVEYIDLERS